MVETFFKIGVFELASFNTPIIWLGRGGGGGEDANKMSDERDEVGSSPYDIKDINSAQSFT